MSPDRQYSHFICTKSGVKDVYKMRKKLLFVQSSNNGPTSFPTYLSAEIVFYYSWLFPSYIMPTNIAHISRSLIMYPVYCWMVPVIGKPAIYEQINLLFDESGSLFTEEFWGMLQAFIILRQWIYIWYCIWL